MERESKMDEYKVFRVLKRKLTLRHPSIFALYPCRLVLPFIPELNTGRRHQNTYLMMAWFLEIASYINSSFNIFVYYSMGSKYRETMKALFCRGRVAATFKTNTEQIVATSVVSTD